MLNVCCIPIPNGVIITIKLVQMQKFLALPKPPAEHAHCARQKHSKATQSRVYEMGPLFNFLGTLLCENI